jgi:Family of unknown function (DUF5317)
MQYPLLSSHACYRREVWLLLATVIAATALVLLTRGSFVQILNIRIAGGWLLASGLVIQVALEYIDFPKNQIETVGYALLMTSYLLILAFCLANIGTRGFVLLAIGVALNTLVIGLNQGMPTRPIGDNAQGKRVFKPVVQTVKHRQAQGTDILGILGDRILFPRPFDTLVSPGDIAIALGICELLVVASRRRPVASDPAIDVGR